MSRLERIPARVCAVRLIAAVQPDFKAELGLTDLDFSLGLFSADSDDVAYIAADEATKQPRCAWCLAVRCMQAPHTDPPVPPERCC